MIKSDKITNLLHLLGPYLPTDRFRALLRGDRLPESTSGAAMVVDFSGFTALTEKLHRESPERASEMLKRVVNPIFEAIAGLVFIHGGSVIRFTGDGFTAWFDDMQSEAFERGLEQLSGLERAAIAGLEMQSTMKIFNSLRLKVVIGGGNAQRWVVGNPTRGLNDLLAGEAIEHALRVIGECLPGQVLLYQDTVPYLFGTGFTMEISESGSAVLKEAPLGLIQLSRGYRWPPWKPIADETAILDEARLFVPANIRDQIQLGLGDYTGELRPVLPMFIQFEVEPLGVNSKRSALDGYFSTIQESLAAAGGWMVSIEISDKGTVVYAVFGAPVTHGDDAIRALTAAIELRDKARTNPIVTSQRIGMSRGLLYSGIVGGQVRHEYSSIGDETNIAARLMTAAPPGQVLVSAAIRKEAGARFNFGPANEINVKGREEAISVSLLQNVRLVSHAKTAPVALTGRNTEMMQIENNLREAKNGFPRIIRLEGSAGIGKSRIVVEVFELAKKLNFRAAAGDCLSIGEKLSYLPYQEMLTSLFQLGADDDEAVRIERLRTLVESLEPGWLPRLPLLGKALNLDIPDTPATAALDRRRRNQVEIAFVADVILRMASRQPILIVLEDLQWIDELSQLLTFELARRLSLAPMPICILLTHRVGIDSEYLQLLVQGLSDLRFQTVIRLHELARTEVFMMINAYLSVPAPEAVANYVYDLARGNPFFVKELIDALVDTRRLIVRGNYVRLEADWEQTKLPQTIQGLVQSRVDRLEELDKIVLKTASVIGMEFQFDLLAGSMMINASPVDVYESLSRLIERDLIQRDTLKPDATQPSRKRLEQRGTAELRELFAFKHAITQEVIYQSLPFTQREQFHTGIARALRNWSVQNHQPEPIERLAYHYSHTQDHAQAYTYLMAAGAKAAREYANQSALDYYTRAFVFADTEQQQFEAQRLRVALLLALSSNKQAERELPTVESLANRSGDPLSRTIVYNLKATLAVQTSAWSSAVENATTALTHARKAHDDAQEWEALRLLRIAYQNLRRFDDAEALDKSMQELAGRLQDERYHLQLLLSWLQADTISEVMPFLHNAQQILEQARAAGDPILEAECWYVVGNAQFRAQYYTAAIDSYARQAELARTLSDKRLEGLSLVGSGTAMVLLGQTGEGHRRLLAGYSIMREAGDRAAEANCLLYLGVVSVNHRTFDEGVAYMNRSLAIQRMIGVRPDMAVILFHTATCYIMLTRSDQADDVLSEAEQIFTDAGMDVRADEVRIARAENAWRSGALDACRGLLATASDRFLRGSLEGAILPGLAYWRLMMMADSIGDQALYTSAREAMLRYLKTILDRIPTTSGKQDFLLNLWYHSEILTGADLKTLGV